MIDHLTLTVRDVDRSVAFYSRVLEPLGYRMLVEFDRVYGFGAEKPEFWLKQDDPPTTPQHLAFAAATRAAVDAFHEAALGAGALDNGAPGLREHYHPTYYAAFVYDPDGHPIEAVNHGEARRSPSRRTPRKRVRAAKARGARKGAGGRARGSRPRGRGR